MTRTILITMVLWCCYANLWAQDGQTINENNTNPNLLYIGFEKSTTLSQRLQILEQAGAKLIEQLNLMDYPIFRIELDEPPSDWERFKEQLQNEKGVMFVSDERNLNEKQINAIAVKRQGEMSISPNSSSNGSSKNQYHQIILNHMPGLNVCVERYYPQPRRHHIKALYEITITPSGAVKTVRLLDSNMKDLQLRNCLQKKISNWHDFPRRRDEEDMTLKFEFKY